MMNEQRKLQQIIDMSVELAEVNDLDVLLEKILTLAREFMNADAGSIYVVDGDELKFSNTQNDTLQERLPPGKKLIYTTFSVPINNESISGYVASTGASLNIPDVYQLPSSVPYRFGKQYDELSRYRTTSMLTVPLRTSRGAIVGVLQMINAKDREGKVTAFSREDERFIAHFASSAAVALERAQMTRALILRMISMAELRDPKETGAHVNRVAMYSVEVYEQWARSKGMSQEEIDRSRDVLRMAAMLHDVGKVAISDAILKKPGRLDPEEYEAMKQHTYLGARLFINPSSEFDEMAAEVALNHHENWDGSGYPGYVDVATGQSLSGYEEEDGKARGKKDEEIPVFGRIVAVSDVYDALSSRRSYKEAFDEDRTLGILQEESGTKFEPDIVEALFSSLDVIRSIAGRYPDQEL